MKALELLRAHINKIPPDATMREMVDMLDLYQVLLLPVVGEDDQLVGTVYEDQVLQSALGSGASELRDHPNRERARDLALTICARDIMIAPPVAADERDDALDVLARMQESGLTRLPVTSKGRVVGTISRVDICQALLENEL
jgi:CBS-domain-containing membrane protein